MAKLESVNMLPVRYKIASIIRKAILSGEYETGEELSLTEIAEQLGVSRTPVREAFQMLNTEGLIELRLNKGAIVKGISEKVIKDHFDIRNILEGEAVARAALKSMDFTELKESQEFIEQLGNDFTVEQFQHANQLFHTAIWKAADNEKMYEMLISLWNGSSFGKTVSEKEHQIKSIEEHRKILEYMIAGNPYNAKIEMKNHLMRSMQNILDSYWVAHKKK